MNSITKMVTAILISAFILVGIVYGYGQYREWSIQQQEKREAQIAEQHERIGRQEAQNYENCRTLIDGNSAPHIQTPEETQKALDDSRWLHQHSLTNVYGDGNGNFYDGLTDENYAACHAQFSQK